MVLYLSMVIYPGGGRKKVPAHWGVMATPQENGPVGNVYHAIGDPFRGYKSDIKEEYDISKTNRKYIRVSLGKMDDKWISQVKRMARDLPAPCASPTPLDPFAGDNCQKWALDFLEELVKMGAVDSSVPKVGENCPRV